ncbi:glycosyltransferase family 4 protein [Phenylobacterium sp. LjRoot225]|uniref:glycosyltransferase family 4 protein n=1 Tax=Phenylobacterium sp. LjRoot225 TaxID=3342285 RepID=UPI003ED0874C
MPPAVVHVHWAFPPTTGGVESHLADLGRLQSASGRRVVILTGEPDPVRHPAYEVVSSPLMTLKRARVNAATPEADAPALAVLIADLVARTGADVIHGHNLHHFSPAPAIAVEALRHQLGISAHHTFHETWPDILTDRPLYRGWEGTYAISGYIQQQCAELIGFRPDLLHPGIDTERFRPVRAPFSGTGPAVLLHPARLLPWKGVHISVEALRRLRDRGHDVRLVLTDTQRIADWDGALPAYRRQVLGQIEALGLTAAVQFVSARYDEMPALYDIADVALYPTIQGEPYGLVPPEAMSAGRPVVASRCGGIVETVVDGETGFLVEPGDADHLANRIEVLLEDPPLARRMGEAGRARIERHFSASGYVSALERRYAVHGTATPADC